METINWTKEVENRQEQLMSDLFDLLSINSIKDVEHKTDDMPLGPGPAKALFKFLEIAERDGFVTKNIENVAGHIEFGEGDETLGILGHVDVVPVDDNWDSDPFKPEIRDGKLYARGSSDDKGPSMAAYYALKIIKDLGLPTSKKVRFIIGTDEESGWYCMDRYQANEKMPDFGFSPDAQFPIINGEKGLSTFDVNFNLPVTTDGNYQLTSFTAGLRTNMVPGDAHATLLVNQKDDTLEERFNAFLADNNLQGSLTSNDNNVTLEVIGKAAHAQNPKAGVNAATFLATFLANEALDASGKEYVSTTAKFLHNDPSGELTGINHTDSVMGELTSSPNIFAYTPGEEQLISINIRFPQGIDAETIIKNLSATFPNATVAPQAGLQGPHYVSADDELVKTLLEVYEEHTGQKGAEKTIGGGTYGRLFERGVAYGALFPGREDVMHQANEYMHVEDIYKSAIIYADAIYRLIK
ncbi:dipeptidase PepV [Vagococcus xieshaowenii]|uniref:Dipeptidase PepV n=1 Tax=Vagococcus xieshaowenii TaxID=2562451 RepID=A0AAJ5EEW0_9ENTE|nr:dipeptidase PepV [Vagococcus xieshaowenii]QCA29357.1 dipeptidase PepV [Vagococcus xieshaowenii]TFZ39351.1 dipeptidase PepV [Vagococcus xieshaowenii]